MRHFRDELRVKGYDVIYHDLGSSSASTLAGILTSDLKRLVPGEVRMVRAGDHRVHQSLERAVGDCGIDFVCLPDKHFLCDRATFDEWAASGKQLRLEHFYRFMRASHDILTDNSRPEGGKWNFDSDNRKSFSKHGPGMNPPWPGYPPDPTTREVIKTVEKRVPDHPGELSGFDWPVTRTDSADAFADFVSHRLATFGPYQDAMWTDEPFLYHYHSGAAAALNVKLLNPSELSNAAVDAYASKRAPLASVEWFVRQILGWREYVRGIYWRHMPGYVEQNALSADCSLPSLMLPVALTSTG